MKFWALLPCRISGSHCGDYEGYGVTDSKVAKLKERPTFRNNTSTALLFGRRINQCRRYRNQEKAKQRPALTSRGCRRYDPPKRPSVSNCSYMPRTEALRCNPLVSFWQRGADTFRARHILTDMFSERDRNVILRIKTEDENIFRTVSFARSSRIFLILWSP
jgi:hypothetical protein